MTKEEYQSFFKMYDQIMNEIDDLVNDFVKRDNALRERYKISSDRWVNIYLRKPNAGVIQESDQFGTVVKWSDNYDETYSESFTIDSLLNQDEYFSKQELIYKEQRDKAEAFVTKQKEAEEQSLRLQYEELKKRFEP